MSKISINYLSAGVALTKVFRANGDKDSYPLIKNFTSHTEQIETIEEFHASIVEHAKLGHCLLKGNLTRTLNQEPRANSTRTDDPTRYVCLDFDRHETPDIDETLAELGLGDVSYIIQYSSSHGLPDTMGTVSAHVFMLIDHPVMAPMLKAWLMKMNMKNWPDQLELHPSGTTIKWPLDVTTCQNDKLLYIAPPIFEKPLKDPLRTRIHLVKKKRPMIAAEKTFAEQNMATLRAEARTKVNELRKEIGLPSRTARTSWVGKHEIENKPEACAVSEIMDCGDFVRLNVNGGDSWAYWHPKDNFELIHDFKTESVFRTKEFLPGYYAQLVGEKEVELATPSEEGDLLLAFRDIRTAEYYNGTWNPENQKLTIYRAKDVTQLNHWLMSHGRTPPEFVPPWDMTYDPCGDWIVDEENHRINTFKKSHYMGLQADKSLDTSDFPEIYRMIRHFLGENDKDKTISDHFLNWFAVIFQRKAKPRTAWVNHGVQGTGKGYFMSKVVTPLFGKENVAEVNIDTVEDQFNSWLEGKLFVNVNEIDTNDFSEKGRVEAKFKMLITDNVMPIRRMRQTMSQEPNWASFLFSSNKRKPVAIPLDDRRHNVGEAQKVKLVPPKEEDVSNELEAFAKWLLAHKADVALSHQIIQTESRAMMQRLGVNSIEETIQAIIDGDFDHFWMNMVPDEYVQRGSSFNEDERIYNATIRDIAHRIVEEGCHLSLSRDEIGTILVRNVGSIRREPNKLTSTLRQNGLETKQIRHKGKKTYGIHVTWRVSDEIRKEIEKELGVRPKPKLRRAK